MRISVIGPGRIGGGLARLWARNGLEIMVCEYRDQDKVNAIIDCCDGRAVSGSIADAMAFSDVVLLSPVCWRIDAIAEQTNFFAGKTVIDTTNSYNDDWTPKAVVGARSTGELNARKFPSAHFVKAYNCIPYWFIDQILEDASTPPLAVFCGGDDGDAKSVAVELIQKSGFTPFDVGGLEKLPLCEMDSPVYGHGVLPEDAAAYLSDPQHWTPKYYNE